MENENIRYIPIEEFIEKSKPTNWIKDGIEEDLYNWKKTLENDFNLKMSLPITIVHDFKKKRSLLNLNGNLISLMTKEVYEEEFERLNEEYEEIDFKNDIEKFEGYCSDLERFGWLFYKTIKNFSVFKQNSSDFTFICKIGENLCFKHSI